MVRAAVLATVLAGLCIWAAPAPAATTYEPAGGFAENELSNPSGIAVDRATGNVLVVDSGNSRVRVFEPSGGSASLLTEFGAGELSSPYGIAIDQSNGDVYVTDPGNNRVVRYETDGAPTPTYTRDSDYTGPPFLVESFASPIAVDPLTGDLLIADTVGKRVTRYSSADETQYIGLFDGSGTPGGQFTSLFDIAIDEEGDILVVADGEFESFYGEMKSSRVREFTGAGVEKGQLGAPGELAEARSIEAGEGSTVLVGTGGGTSFGEGVPVTLRVFRNGTPVASVPYDGNPESAPVGLAIDGGATGSLYALTGISTTVFGEGGGPGEGGVAGVQAFDALLLPDVNLDPPVVVDMTQVHLTGTVDPVGEAATYRFEYSADGGKTWTETAEQSAGSGTGPVAVEAEVEGLAAPELLFRLAAENANGTIVTKPRLVELLYDETLQAIQVEPTEARLRAKVYPGANPTSYRFEYGTDTSYGSSTQAIYAGARRPTLVSRLVSGLSAGTTYHYRVAATNETGTRYGADRTFTTPVTSPVGRAYEQVSPVDKGGVEVKMPNAFVSGFSTPVLADGNAVNYLANGSFGDAPVSLFYTTYQARRSAAGWGSKTVEDPQQNLSELRFGGVIATSRDGSSVILGSHRALTPDAVERAFNLYLKDTEAETLELISSSSNNPGVWDQYGGSETLFRYVGGSDNFDHVVFGSKLPLTPDAPAGEMGKIYEFSDGELRLVSLMPDGEPPALEPSMASSLANDYFVSADGSRIYFSVGAFGEGGLFMRENGQTIPISVSQRTGDTDEPKPALFLGASRDGSVVYFKSASRLTNDSNVYSTDWLLFAVGDIYKYDLETEELTDITSSDIVDQYPANGSEAWIDDVQPSPGISDDGSFIYFKSTARLTDDAVFGAFNMYVASGDELRLVHTRDPKLGFGAGGLASEIRFSPSGEQVVFQSDTAPPGYETRSPACFDESGQHAESRCRVLYLYDWANSSLQCVSCNPSGEPPEGDASAGNGAQNGIAQPPNAVTDSGEVFFSSWDKLVPEDVNGRIDAYSWKDGEARLISTGSSTHDSRFLNASPDGRDVFFVTDQRLVGQDQDDLYDLYDARRGGGFASQNPPTPQAQCSGEGCQAAAPTPGAQSAPASSVVGGRGNVRKQAHCKKAKAKRGAGKKARVAKKARQGGCKGKKAKGSKGAGK